MAQRIRLLLDEAERGWRRRIALPVAAMIILVGMPLAAIVRVGFGVGEDPIRAIDASHAAIHHLPHEHP